MQSVCWILRKRKCVATSIVVSVCVIIHWHHVTRTYPYHLTELSLNRTIVHDVVAVDLISNARASFTNATHTHPTRQSKMETACQMNSSKINPFAFEAGYLMPSELREIKDNLEKTKALRDCAPFHFSKVPLPRTALASFPGSGNTWSRYLIQQLTGELAALIYLSRVIK